MREAGYMVETGHILCGGLSYCAQALLPHLADWDVSATLRDETRASAYQRRGVRPVIIKAGQLEFEASFKGVRDVTHILLSAPPTPEADDPLYDVMGDWMRDQPLKWVGYLSTTGVYGDYQGAWVDEDSPPGRLGVRGERRLAAENKWRAWGEATGVPVQCFRLPGIYGPGRSAIESVTAQTARRIMKPGQVFSRIHVEDLAQTVFASMQAPQAGRVYNVCDDLPAPPQDVIAYAADLLDCAPPDEIDFETAELSPMARSFYAENKRVRNDRIKAELGVVLKYPTYREGLAACHAAFQARRDHD